MEAPFASSLLVEIRKRMGQNVFEVFHEAIINTLHNARAKTKAGTIKQATPDKEEDDNEGPTSSLGDVPKEKDEQPQGKLILDATVAPQAIRYPTDLSLLNESRQFSEQIIDKLFPESGREKKPRTYRENALKAYLAVVKQRRPAAKVLRRAIRQQLQYLRRSLGYIEQLLDNWSIGREFPLPSWLLHRYWVIQHVYDQQREMYQNRSHRCDNRIVSISQPHVRPIIRGKQDKAVEFGSKLSVSLTEDGVARVDYLRWNAFNEGGDLKAQVEDYRQRYGHYPEAVLGDPAYGTRENRAYLQSCGSRFAGKPLGRPRKVTEANQEEGRPSSWKNSPKLA